MLRYILLTQSLILLLLLVTASEASGQRDCAPDLSQVNLTTHKGFVIPHHPEVKNLITEHSTAFGICFSRPARHQGNQWSRHYPESQLGIDLLIADLGNTSVLGHQLSMSPYVDLQLFQTTRLEHRLKMGAGLGYSTKQWDLIENVQNTFISSPLSAALSMQTYLNYWISDRFAVSAGMRMTHFSNAAYRMPNLGTNMPSAFLGIIYTGHHRWPSGFEQQYEDTSFTRSLSLRSQGAYCQKEILPPLGKKYHIATFSTWADYRVTYKSSLQLQADVMYNESLPVLIEDSGIESQSGDAVRLGIAAGYALHFDVWQLAVQLGAYLKNSYAKSGWMYNRVRVSYDFAERWLASIALKTHKTVADHAEIGIGYRWKN